MNVKVPRDRRYCVVYGCLNNNSNNNNLSFFSLPADFDRRLEWLRVIAREDLIDRGLNHRVCEIHFKTTDINTKAKRKVLMKNAVPCMYLPTKLDVALTTNDASTQTGNIFSHSKEGPSVSHTVSTSFQVNQVPTCSEKEFLHFESKDVDTAPTLRFLPSKLEYLNDNEVHFVDVKEDMEEENSVILPPPGAPYDYVHPPNIKTEFNRTGHKESLEQPIETNITEMHRSLTKDKDFAYDIKCEPMENPETDTNYLQPQTTGATYLKPVSVCKKYAMLTISPHEIISITPEPELKCDQEVSASPSTTSRKTQVDLPLGARQKLYELCDKFLSPKLSEFVKMQSRLKNDDKAKGNRYTEDYKLFCINLHKSSPQAYPVLEDLLCLPSDRTLRRWAQRAEVVGDQSEEIVFVNNQETQEPNNHRDKDELCEQPLEKQMCLDISM